MFPVCVRQLVTFLSPLNVWCFCVHAQWFVSTWQHWHVILFIISVSWKTKHFVFAWSARWSVRNLLLASLNSLLTILWWLLCDRLPWLPDSEGTFPSICVVAIASTLPHSNLSSLPLLLFHPVFPLLQYTSIHTEKRGEGRGCWLFEKLRLQKHWTRPTKAGERERQATGAIKNS